MKKTGIIGLGTITKHYLAGLNDSPVLKLTAVCDTLDNPASLEYYKDYTFYRDYKEMIKTEKLEYVIISTPPATHYEIASYALSRGVSVIVKKPAVLTMDEYHRLLDLARENGVVFEVMFHWQNGSEVLKFNELYDPCKISEIKVTVLDPYSADGVTIDSAKVKLEGAWIDSGVNILSMIRMWLPFEYVTVDNIVAIKCEKTNLPIFIDLDMHIDGVKVNIVIDWRMHKDNKCTQVVHDNYSIDIDHSLQQIKNEDLIILDCYKMKRLPQHYYNYFKNYCEKPDTDAAKDIHKILLEVNKQL